LPTGLRELAANIFQAVAHTETQAHLLMEFFDASNVSFDTMRTFPLENTRLALRSVAVVHCLSM